MALLVSGALFLVAICVLCTFFRALSNLLKVLLAVGSCLVLYFILNAIHSKPPHGTPF